MPQYLNSPFKYDCTGLNLSRPSDDLPQGKFPYLFNVQSIGAGNVANRYGTTRVNTTPLADTHINSIRRLNDPLDGTFTRVVGAGTNLYTGQSTFTQQDTGYSGNPLTMVPYRPSNAVQAWMYVADLNKMRKVRVDGVNYLMGVQAPQNPPIAYQSAPYWNIMQATNNASQWSNTGTAGGVSNQTRISTTIADIIYDNAVAVTNTGWCSISPVAGLTDAWQPGAFIFVGSGSPDLGIIHDVFPAATTTPIAAIIYDAGNTGPCSVVPTAPSSGIVPQALIQLDSEVVQIQSVSASTDEGGQLSFRCTTTSTHVVGGTITGVASFRTYLNDTWTAGANLVSNGVQSTVGSGTGSITYTAAQNQNVLAQQRPLLVDDYMHVSVKVDNLSAVVQGWVEVDTSDGSFTQNYFYYNFTPTALLANQTGQTTLFSALATQQQQAIVSVPTNTAPIAPGAPEVATGQGIITLPDGSQVVQDYLSLGNSQWSELKFSLNQMVAVGTAKSFSMGTIAAIRVQLQTTASVVMQISSWWIGGGVGLDVGATGTPVLYSYRYRSSTTGAKSNPSPAIRSGFNPQREPMDVQVAASADPQVDTIDLFRFGAGVDEWHLLYSIPNQTVSYFDTYSSLDIATNELLEFDNYVPFPVTDTPRGGVVNVAGTSVTFVSGDAFNTNWAPGSQIIIAGVPYELYGQPVSSTFLQIVESGGAGTNVEWSMPQATIIGKPLSAMWSFGGLETGTYMFAVGDNINPGTLYWTKPNSPDTASDTGFLEITSPSDGLVNGFVFDGRNFVFSSTQLYTITPDPSGTNGFVAQVVASVKGLFNRDGMTLTPTGAAFLANDGVYLTPGAGQQNITDADLYPLFPHGSEVGPGGSGYPAINFARDIQLFYTSNYIYMVYTDVTGPQWAFKFDSNRGGWFPEQYAAGVGCIYQEEGDGVTGTLMGTNNGFICQMFTGALDQGNLYDCAIQTPYLDQEQQRANKVYVDLMVDVELGSATNITPTILYDNGNSFFNPSFTFPTTPTGRAQVPISALPNTVALHQNISLLLLWTGAGTLYEFQALGILQAHTSIVYFSQNTNFNNYAHTRDGWIGYISTAPVTFTIIGDNTNFFYTLPSTGGAYQRIYQTFDPIKALLFAFQVTCPQPMVLFAEDTIVRLKTWGGEEYLNHHPFEGENES